MLDVLMIALFQAAAGAPQPAPAIPATTPAQEQSEGQAQQAEPQAAEAEQQPRRMRRERRCQEIEITGRRLPQRVCETVMVPDDRD